MPLHEFICKKCGHQMEKLIFNETEEKSLRCEKCGDEVKKILSTFSFEVNGFNEKNSYSRKPE